MFFLFHALTDQRSNDFAQDCKELQAEPEMELKSPGSCYFCRVRNAHLLLLCMADLK